MARGFRRRRGRYLARLSPQERSVVVSLMEQVRELLGGEPETGDAFDDLVAGLEETVDEALDGPGEDPALRRLLPDGHRDDPLAAAEFRRLSQAGLRRRKSETLSAAIDALGRTEDDRVDLDAAQAQAVLVALTDVRLVLGERLGLRTEQDAHELEVRIVAGQESGRAPLILTYDFLTWLQETLARALLP